MSKATILKALRKATSQATRPARQNDDRLLDRQPQSSLTSIDWLTENFAVNSISWQAANNSQLAKAVEKWVSSLSRKKKAEIICEPVCIDLLGKTTLTLAPFKNARAEMPYGLSLANAALAETGTLVMHSDSKQRTPSLHFLCRHHCVILYQTDICRYMEEYWQSQPDNLSSLRAINYISGPSRTGDVEQTIQIGAHGPLSVHVIIVKR